MKDGSESRPYQCRRKVRDSPGTPWVGTAAGPSVCGLLSLSGMRTARSAIPTDEGRLREPSLPMFGEGEGRLREPSLPKIDEGDRVPVVHRDDEPVALRVVGHRRGARN